MGLLPGTGAPQIPPFPSARYDEEYRPLLYHFLDTPLLLNYC